MNPLYKQISDLQLSMADVTPESIQEIKDQILSTKYFQEEIDGQSLLLENFLTLVNIRFSHLDTIVDLFISLLNDFPNLKQLLLNKVFHFDKDDGNFLLKTNSLFFLRFCYKKDLFAIQEIIKNLQLIPNPDSYQQHITFIAFFFLDDIFYSNEEYFNIICKYRKNAETNYFFGLYMKDIPLFETMKENQFKELHLLLEKGYLDPLLVSIRNDDINMFNSLSISPNFDQNMIIKKSIFDPNYTPNSDISLIDFAILSNAISIFKMMLLNNYNLDDHIFEFAACSCNNEIIHILANEGKTPTKCLAYAAAYRPSGLFQWIIQQYYPSLDSENKEKLSQNVFDELSFAFGEAVKMNNFSCLTYCLDRSIDLCNSTNNSDFKHPLFLALNSPFILKYLLEIPEINLNPVSYNSTPFLLTVQMGNEESFNILLNKKGVNINYEDQKGMNAFMWASMNGHLSIVKSLYETHKFNINQTDSMYHETALYKACAEGRTEIVEFLLSLPEIDTSIKSNQDNTCLHISCQRNRIEIVKLLINSGKVNKLEPGFHNILPQDMTSNQEIKSLF